MWHTVVVILNSDRTQAVSTLGWVDKGSLWMTSVDKESPRTVFLSDANYLSVFAGEQDHFAVVHHWDGGRLEISAHAYSNPQAVISRLSLREAISGIPSRVEILKRRRSSRLGRFARSFHGICIWGISTDSDTLPRRAGRPDLAAV